MSEIHQTSALCCHIIPFNVQNSVIDVNTFVRKLTLIICIVATNHQILFNGFEVLGFRGLAGSWIGYNLENTKQCTAAYDKNGREI